MIIDRVADVLTDTALHKTDLIFPALHGGDGEDGHLQALLDLLDIPYALSGPLASALAMDKAATKRLLRGAGIPTADWLQITWNRERKSSRTVSNGTPDIRATAAELTLDHIQARAADELGYPLVVKLNSGGSSVGVEIVDKPADFDAAFNRVAATSDLPTLDLLIERFIPGRELTAAIFLGRRLPLLEIRPREGFYDFTNKYTRGASDYLVPAPVNSPLYEQISDDALRAFDLLGCRGLARVDFRLDGDEYYCLEVNTIPGMTEMSLVPMAAEAVGIGFDVLVDALCRDGLDRAARASGSASARTAPAED